MNVESAENRGGQGEVDRKMKLRYNSVKAMLLGAALLLLSAKGAQELVIDETFSLVVNLPSWLVTIKMAVTLSAAVLMAGYAILAVLVHKRVVSSLAMLIYVAVLAYYFLRSAILASNVEGNLLAPVILAAFAVAISLDSEPSTARGVSLSGWIRACSYFCHGYVAANIALLITGYGYSQNGSRFFGFTYHPNAEGAFAALCAGFFFVKNYCFEPERPKRQWLGLIFLITALFLVVASGSRTATLMTFLAFICILRIRHMVLAGVAMVFAIYFFLIHGAAGDEASIGGAITRMITAPAGNREEVWGLLISDFVTHPFLGVGDTTSVSASGFLTAFAGGGVLSGSLFFLIFALAARRAISIVLEFRRGCRRDSRLLAAILLLQILLGAIFEALMFDKFSPFPLLTMICLVAIGTKREDRTARTPKGQIRRAD